MDNQFNGLTFFPNEIEMFGSAENCYKTLTNNVFNNLKKYFKHWFKKESLTLHIAPALIVPMFLTYSVQNDKYQGNKEFQKHRINEINNTVLFLNKYKKLLNGRYKTVSKGPMTERDKLAELLIKYNISGFGHCQLLSEKERHLREMLKKV